MSSTALPEEIVNLREYTMKLLSRYLYLSGSLFFTGSDLFECSPLSSAKSVSHFHMLKSPEHASRVFKMIQDNPDVSILGLNDDIDEGYDQVKAIMAEWFSFRWPRRAVWERGWDPIVDRLSD